MLNIGKHIEAALNSRGLTKQAFANEIGLSKQQLNALLRGKSVSTVNTLKVISALLDVPSDYLLQDADKWFLIAAIDDYVGMINNQNAETLLKDAILLLQEGVANKKGDNSDG